MENLLKRLRELRAQECRLHIDRQIELWLNHQQQPHEQQQQQKQQHPQQQQQQQQQQHQSQHQQPHHRTPQIGREETRQKLASDEKTIGFFLANLKHLESLDSDATESTSSNDSYDELEGFTHEDIPPRRNAPLYKSPHSYAGAGASSSSAAASRRASQIQSSEAAATITAPLPSSSHLNQAAVSANFAQMADLKKKAIWKWAKERSRLASKWTWLQAQIADLEFRVRGQNDALMQARIRKVPPIPPSLTERSCSRTVPLSRDFRNRSLIKSSQILSDSSKSTVKLSQVPCVCSALPQTVAPCLSCRGRYNYLMQQDGENAPILERASMIDTGCHPVLSFPDDITLGSQISFLLKQETINRKPMKGKPGRKKGSTSVNVTSPNGDKAGGKHATKKGKYYQSMTNRGSNHPQGNLMKNPSQTMIASNKLKRKYRKHSNNPNNYDSNNWFGANNHAHNNNNYNNSTKRNKRIRSASSMNDSSLHSDSSNPNHFSNSNSTNPRSVTRRRRSEQSAYDIDNIVIPFSVAATTRVEILEYKEIMTPSWRVWENGTCQIDKVKSEEDEEVEDTSDEAYIQRHTKGEHEEKKRFSLKPPPKNEI